MLVSTGNNQDMGVAAGGTGRQARRGPGSGGEPIGGRPAVPGGRATLQSCAATPGRVLALSSEVRSYERGRVGVDRGEQARGSVVTCTNRLPEHICPYVILFQTHTHIHPSLTLDLETAPQRGAWAARQWSSSCWCRSGDDLGVLGWGPASVSMLSVESACDSPPLPLPAPSRTFSLSQINK